MVSIREIRRLFKQAKEELGHPNLQLSKTEFKTLQDKSKELLLDYLKDIIINRKNIRIRNLTISNKLISNTK